MSAMRHATISAWQRHEDGSYAAELHGWTLRVRWRPERGEHERRGFLWSAEGPGRKLAGDEIFEEIEVAMAHAEEAVAPDAAAHEAKTVEINDAEGRPPHSAH